MGSLQERCQALLEFSAPARDELFAGGSEP